MLDNYPPTSYTVHAFCYFYNNVDLFSAHGVHLAVRDVLYAKKDEEEEPASMEVDEESEEEEENDDKEGGRVPLDPMEEPTEIPETIESFKDSSSSAAH